MFVHWCTWRPAQNASPRERELTSTYLGGFFAIFALLGLARRRLTLRGGPPQPALVQPPQQSDGGPLQRHHDLAARYPPRAGYRGAANHAGHNVGERDAASPAA